MKHPLPHFTTSLSFINQRFLSTWVLKSPMTHLQSHEDLSPNQCDFLFTKIRNVIFCSGTYYLNVFVLFYVYLCKLCLKCTKNTWLNWEFLKDQPMRLLPCGIRDGTTHHRQYALTRKQQERRTPSPAQLSRCSTAVHRHLAGPSPTALWGACYNHRWGS